MRKCSTSRNLFSSQIRPARLFGPSNLIENYLCHPTHNIQIKGRGQSTDFRQASFSRRIQEGSSEKATMAIHQVNNMDIKVKVDLKLSHSGFAQLIHSPSKWVVEPMQVLKRKTLGGQNMSLKHNYCSLSRMAIMILSPIIVAKLTIMHHFRLTHTTGTSASTTKWACSPPFCLKWSV